MSFCLAVDVGRAAHRLSAPERMLTFWCFCTTFKKCGEACFESNKHLVYNILWRDMTVDLESYRE